MRKGQSIVVHHTGNYYTASCKMVFWLPGHLAAWLSGRLGHICQKPLLSGPPLPAAVHHKLLVVETLKLYWKRTEIIVALYSGPTGEEKSILIPVVPEKKKQDDEKPTHKMRKCLSTTKMLAKKLWRWKIIFFDVVVNDDIYYEKIKSLLLMYTQKHTHITMSFVATRASRCWLNHVADAAAHVTPVYSTAVDTLLL